MTERKMLTLSGFKGVDLSSAPTMVSPNRASYSINMINDNGINHKRPGWDEQLKLSGRINGMYHYVNGEKNALIVYAGESFYEVKIETMVAEKLEIKGESLEFIDNRVQFFMRNDKLYVIGCGDYLVYGDWGEGYQMIKVADSPDIYIPTTIIEAQAEIWRSDESTDDIKITRDDRYSVTPGVSFEEHNLLLSNGRHKERFKVSEIISGDYAVCRLAYPFTGMESIISVCGDDGSEYTGELRIEKYHDGDDNYSKVIVYGYGLIGNSEVIIEYVPASFTDNSSYITKCSFGTVFGAYGGADRLFISGNSDMPNADFYSEYDDFTYFKAKTQTVMGRDEVPITGYLRLSDSVLATLKADNAAEPTIYYRSAVERENSEGLTEVDFTRWAGGINEGCVNPHTVVNLAGDDIFVSPNGVYGVVQIQNTSKNDRYIRQRDMLINAELRKRDLKEAVSFVYQNRYYLSLGNGECYVADPRYQNYVSEDIDGSFNYEWWKWTNVPARVFANVDGELWFGTDSGLLCRFDGEFSDRTYVDTHAGDISVSGDTVIFNTALDIKKGDAIKLVCQNETDIFSLYLNNAEVVDGYVKCSADDIVRVYAGQTVYADNVGDSGLAVNVAYTVNEVDKGNCTFALEREGERLDIESGGFALHRAIGNNVFEVSKVENGTFKLKDNYGDIDFTAYNSQTPAMSKFIHKQNVCSEWYTPVLDLGASHLHKTLYRLNVTLDPNVRGSLKVGYETNDKLAYIGASVGKAFNFEDFSFNDFSFTTGFTVAQSQKVKARNFNYIMFRFVSDNDKDCAIDNFSAEYTYNGGRFAGIR